jgi:hypothetical protein
MSANQTIEGNGCVAHRVRAGLGRLAIVRPLLDDPGPGSLSAGRQNKPVLARGQTFLSQHHVVDKLQRSLMCYIEISDTCSGDSCIPTMGD